MFRTAAMRLARSLAIGAASLSPAAVPVWCVPKAAASGAAVPPDSASRGALIVFEGVDRSGKTTQARLLAERLAQNGVKAKFMCFPGEHLLFESCRGRIERYLTPPSSPSPWLGHEPQIGQLRSEKSSTLT